MCSRLTSCYQIHLHGHDFVLLQQSNVSYVNASYSLNLKFDNPPRRDVVLLPRKGFVVIGFKADNPGAWLIHCHIGKLDYPPCCYGTIQDDGETDDLL